jgi:hypothetical protein
MPTVLRRRRISRTLEVGTARPYRALSSRTPQATSELSIQTSCPLYVGIADENTEHEAVKHREKEYPRGDVHTNSLENIWSLLKRSIIGSYHQVSAKHLDAYLDELEFRFNNRENPHKFRDALCKLLVANNLPYAKLVRETEASS